MKFVDAKARKSAEEVARKFSVHLNGVVPSYEIKERADGPYLLFQFALPHDRFSSLLNSTLKEISEDNPFRDRSTIVRRKKSPEARLSLPETQLLRTTLSESLTVDRHSFEDDFFSRYTASVTNFEHQIVTNASYLVYGRRGAGKSSLLAFALHKLEKDGRPFAWIALQTYSGRGDVFVCVDVLREILEQFRSFSASPEVIDGIVRKLSRLSSLATKAAETGLGKLRLDIRTAIDRIVRSHGQATIFLDDVHVILADYQPVLLDTLYAVSRGNRCHIKASGIEQLSYPWRSSTRQGLEPSHDAQVLKLDYNLTTPDKSKQHIENILDAHAQYCGLPDIAYLSRKGAISRLVWVAAAVPRDALSLFALAIAKASAKSEKRVSVTSINAAASETIESKLRDMEQDASAGVAKINLLLESVKDFCINKQRKNAFLVEIINNEATYRGIQQLAALRLVHVLHEGITPHEAGRRYIALMLDYGFYVGIRAARSVDLFQKEPTALSAKQLRTLPIFRLPDNTAKQ
jgi:hypothetical protein